MIDLQLEVLNCLLLKLKTFNMEENMKTAYIKKVRELILKNRHLIIPFSIAGVMFFFIIFSLGVPEKEEGAEGCGADVEMEDGEISVEGDDNSFMFKASKVVTGKLKIIVDTSKLDEKDPVLLVIQARNNEGELTTAERLVFKQSKLSQIVKLLVGEWIVSAKAFGDKITYNSGEIATEIKKGKNEIQLKLDKAVCEGPSVTFAIKNLPGHPANGDFMFSNNKKNPFIRSKKLLENYFAYRNLSGNPKESESICGNIKIEPETSKATSENTELLDKLEDVEIHFGKLELTKFDHVNLTNPLLKWNILGQAGDYRIYNGESGFISLNGEKILVVNLVVVNLLTSYPLPLDLKIGGNTGYGVGYGEATIIGNSSNQIWRQVFDPNNTGKVAIIVKSLSPVIQGCVGTYDAIVTVQPVTDGVCTKEGTDGAQIEGSQGKEGSGAVKNTRVTGGYATGTTGTRDSQGDGSSIIGNSNRNLNVQPVIKQKQGLVGLWHFEEESGGIASDSSGNGNKGTLNPSGSEPTWNIGKFGKALYFDGKDDYVEVPDNTSLDITDDLTIEAWVKFDGFTKPHSFIVGKDARGERSYGLVVDGGYYGAANTGKAGFIVFSKTSYTLIWGTTTLSTGQWYHIAGTYKYVSNGRSVINVYVNGKLESTVPNAVGPIYAGSAKVQIGARQYSGYWRSFLNGAIDEVRVWSRTLDAEEVMANAHVAQDGGDTNNQESSSSQGVPDDKIDSYTKLLLHMEGADGGTLFEDSSQYNHPVTPTKAITTTGDKKFGDTSATFRSSGYLSIPASNDWVFGSGDWTVDYWVNTTSVGSNQVLFWIYHGNTAVVETQLWLGKLNIYINKGAWGNISTGYSPNNNEWAHHAIVRNGNTIKVYVDGEEKFSYNITGSMLDGEGIQISPVATLNGYIDEFRISKGIARWTSKFTPPTAPY